MRRTLMVASGFGVGILYPPAAAIALATAPEAPAAASARLVLAAGLAILVAPLLLGVIAEMTDITAAWLLVPSICVVVGCFRCLWTKRTGPRKWLRRAPPRSS